MSLWSAGLRDFVFPPPEKRGLLIRHLRYIWQQKCTPTGRVLTAMFIFPSMVVAVIGLSAPIYIFVLFLIAFMLTARLMGFWYHPRVKIARNLPERCACDATVDVRVRMENSGRRPAYDLSVSEKLPPAGIEITGKKQYLDALLPGEAEELHYQFTPRQRGAYELSGPVALSAFPFGIYHAVQEHEEKQRLLVYPRFERLDRINLPVGRKHQPGGLQLVSHTGDSEEFIGNRPYRPGDRLRDLDHRAWARVGGPVVREFEQEYLCRIALVVDTYIPTGTRNLLDKLNLLRDDPGAFWQDFMAEGTDVFDARLKKKKRDMEGAISMGAACADVLSRQEYVVDIFAAGPQLYHFQAGRSLAYLDNILDVLACIEACHDDPFATLTPALLEEISEISTAVVIMLNWDERRESFVKTLRDYGVAVKLVVVSTDEPDHDPRAFISAAGPGKLFTAAEVENGLHEL